MTYALFILCLIQGITEFMPVSSSAHMMMARQFMLSISGDSALYIGLHLGTLCAVIAFYLKDILILLKHFVVGALDPAQRQNNDFNLSLCILIATIPAIFVGYFLKPYLAFIQNNFFIIALSSIIFGAILAFVDDYTDLDQEQITKKNALLIGLGQLFAFFPGGSRLGTTVTVARMLGMSRFSAFYFSMLISIPVVLGACTLMLIEGYQHGVQFFTIDSMWVILCTFVIGMLSLFIMHYCIDRIGYTIFGIYRVIFGLGILLWLWAVQ